MGDSPEGQKSTKNLDILEEGNLIEAVTCYHHVMKDGLAGKKISLDEQRALAGTQEKRDCLCPLEEGRDKSGNDKDIINWCTKKIRRVKAS